MRAARARSAKREKMQEKGTEGDAKETEELCEKGVDYGGLAIFLFIFFHVPGELLA